LGKRKRGIVVLGKGGRAEKGQKSLSIEAIQGAGAEGPFGHQEKKQIHLGVSLTEKGALKGLT